jgi:antitoxin VapB
MSQTRAFKSGNSQAVRIPADMAYADMTQDLTITRIGDVITIVPAKSTLRQMVAELRALPTPPPMQREPIDLPDRDWD